jgi:hypothetical protein
MMDHNNVKSVKFACNPGYHIQLRELIPDGYAIELVDQEQENSQSLWNRDLHLAMEAKGISCDPIFCQRKTSHHDVMAIMLRQWHFISQELGVTCPFNEPTDLLFDEPQIAREISIENFDALIINSYCLSGQVHLSHSQQDSIFSRLIASLDSQKAKFITTQKLGIWPSTTDVGLSLVGIAQLSKRCRMIIGMPTSPFWMCMNKWSYQNSTLFMNLTNDYYAFDLDGRFHTIEMTENLNVTFG